MNALRACRHSGADGPAFYFRRFNLTMPEESSVKTPRSSFSAHSAAAAFMDWNSCHVFLPMQVYQSGILYWRTCSTSHIVMVLKPFDDLHILQMSCCCSFDKQLRYHLLMAAIICTVIVAYPSSLASDPLLVTSDAPRISLRG